MAFRKDAVLELVRQLGIVRPVDLEAAVFRVLSFIVF
jgi:hypothetical protein